MLGVLSVHGPKVDVVREVEGALVAKLPRHRQLILQVTPLRELQGGSTRVRDCAVQMAITDDSQKFASLDTKVCKHGHGQLQPGNTGLFCWAELCVASKAQYSTESWVLTCSARCFVSLSCSWRTALTSAGDAGPHCRQHRNLL